jgi:hypothetical protein
MSRILPVAAALVVFASLPQYHQHVRAFSASFVSSFHGKSLSLAPPTTIRVPSRSFSSLTMRKQKAGDKRTRRMQRGGALEDNNVISTVTTSPMDASAWRQKTARNQFPAHAKHGGGRQRSRKRSSLYNCLSTYHNHFLSLLTAEYKAEVSRVVMATHPCHLLSLRKIQDTSSTLILMRFCRTIASRSQLLLSFFRKTRL